uniref:Buccalin-like n=1 Tax=Haemonchus contortus TaxID=6289 RepID=A0A7I4YM15_HAECO|nr:unnamed protein product [Haemonchus contortus]
MFLNAIIAVTTSAVLAIPMKETVNEQVPQMDVGNYMKPMEKGMDNGFFGRQSAKSDFLSLETGPQQQAREYPRMWPGPQNGDFQQIYQNVQDPRFQGDQQLQQQNNNQLDGVFQRRKIPRGDAIFGSRRTNGQGGFDFQSQGIAQSGMDTPRNNVNSRGLSSEEGAFKERKQGARNSGDLQKSNNGQNTGPWVPIGQGVRFGDSQQVNPKSNGGFQTGQGLDNRGAPPFIQPSGKVPEY